MSTKERWIIYGIGFVIGCLFLMAIQRLKSNSDKSPTPSSSFSQEATPKESEDNVLP